MESVDVFEMTEEVVKATMPLIEVVESFRTMEAREKVEDIDKNIKMLEGGEANNPIQVVPNCALTFYLQYTRKKKRIC